MGRIQPGRHQAQGLLGLRRQGDRQAACRADDPCARGHDAENAVARGDLGQARLRDVRADIFGYGEGVLPKDVPEMQAQIAIYDKDRALMRARTQAAFDALVKNPMVDPSRIALIGYCFGGGVGIEFASTGAPLAANVAIHGSFRDRAPGWAANAKGVFLILHGAEDPGFPLTTVNRLIEELRSAKIPFQYEVYSGTGHGFSTPKNKAEERANAQSIGATARTLKELFGI